jgi:hypothetical protein
MLWYEIASARRIPSRANIQKVLFMVYIIDGLASKISAAHGSLFSFLLQRSQLIVKVALAERMDKDLAKIEDKYDGGKESKIEAKIDIAVEKKSKSARMLRNVNNAVKKLNAIRLVLFEMRVAADTVATTTFDTKMAALNDKVGSSVLDPESLIGDPGPNATLKRTTVVTLNAATTNVEAEFLGSDYAITRNDGSIIRPDFENKTLNGIAFANYTLTSLAGPASPDAIEYLDGAGSEVGTLSRRGGSIMSAWMYNDFATADDRASALADIDAAILRIDGVERNLRLNRTLLNAGIGRSDLLLDNLTDEFSKISSEQLDAKQAERRAVTVRFDLAVNNLSLIAQTNLTYINGLFLSPDPMEKQDIWDVISGPLPE